jgi:WD40 repeat protein
LSLFPSPPPFRSARAIGRGAATVLVARDGKRIITSVENGPTVLRDAHTLRPLMSLGVRAQVVALSEDGRTLLAGGRGGSVRFVDVASGAVRTAAGRHEGVVLGVAFSADGRTAATGGSDDTVRVWNVAGGTLRESFAGHGMVEGLTFAPDGHTLFSAGADGKVLVWDLAGDRRLGRPFAIRPFSAQFTPSSGPFRGPVPRSYALSPDGRTLAVAHDDGTVGLTDVGSLRAGSTLRAFPARPVVSLGYLADGRLFVSDARGSAVILDPRTGSVGRPLDGVGTPFTPSLSRDGRMMASIQRGGVAVRTLRSGRPSGRLRIYDQYDAASVSLSPDGRTLAVVAFSSVHIVDVATMRLRSHLAGAGASPTAVQFSRDGRWLAAGGLSGWVRMWSTKTWRPASSRVQVQTGPVFFLVISPDSRMLAAGGADGAVQLIDVGSAQPFGPPLPALRNRMAAPVFTPDGAHLLVITDGGRAYRWDLRPAVWARHACDVAGRRLTREEWNEALPGRPYKPAC